MSILPIINLDEAIEIQTCAICLDNMNNDTEIYTIENCNHKFHTKCVLEMFIEGFTDSCPMCRSIISTSNNRNRNFEDFKFKLLLRHSKKSNANILIKNLVKKYNDAQDKIKKLRSQNNIIKKERRIVSKNNDILKKITLTRIKTNRFKKAKKVRIRLYKPRRFYSIIPKDVKELVKKCNIEIKNTIKDNINTLENEMKNLKNSDAYKEFEYINNKCSKMGKNIIKYNRISRKIKDSLLSIPFTPNV